ncbi:MAG: alanine--tRNA ligase [Candidatus Pacearchaeota archaeon]|nr:alanine--tRNA ligase [Candidatus Pacearchaeota archaeon]
MINRKELIRRYLEFFKSKNHKEIPNASLIPENDPTVLFTTAGMHPLVPYLLGQKHALGKRLCNVQKCIRTGDIEGVGDETHYTFFEMLGNWSLGDYWKKEAISYTLEFLTEVLKIPIQKLAVSCFIGDKDAKKDEESAKIWHSLKIPKERIIFLPKKENWWGPAGKCGPCGPDTEIFYWASDSGKIPKVFNQKDKNWVEIGNNVLMQYSKDGKGDYHLANQKNVDFGGGVERTVSALNRIKDGYLDDYFKPIIEEIEELSGKKYGKNKEITKEMRIIADHIKSSVFIIADGTTPGNSEQGYVLRRLIRRIVKYGKELGLDNFTSKIAVPVFDIYNDYSELKENKEFILSELEKEEKKFRLTLEKGMNKFKKFSNNKKISGEEAFLLYQSYGFPIEMIEEECKKKKIKFDRKDFEKEQDKHKELSRTATEGKFKSGLADNSEKTTRLHTASHLLLAALRIVLKDSNIIQRGSNITPERLRLDFSFSRKLTKEEIKEAEDLVNAEIQKSCEVVREEMSKDEAKKKGASGIFDNKYGERVSIYTIEDFSKEICAGPHVKNTCEMGKFKILQEESSSSGVRRIKAVLE